MDNYNITTETAPRRLRTCKEPPLRLWGEIFSRCIQYSRHFRV